MHAQKSLITGTVEAIWSPNIQVDVPVSTRPLAGAVVEALHEGNVVAASTTDDAGRYELRVHPGTYLIRSAAKGPRSPESSRTVTVAAGETLTVTLLLDIGIRCHWGHRPATCPLRTRCRWVNEQAQPPFGSHPKSQPGERRLYGSVLAAGLGWVAATGAASAAPTTGQASGARTPNSSSSFNVLFGVSAVSHSNAWAVGRQNTTGAFKTTVLHWNGTAWSKIKSPSPSSSENELYGVSAVSGSDAWAVGFYWNGTARTYDHLILHWNGTAWSKIKSPNPSSSANQLYAVSARSSSGA